LPLFHRRKKTSTKALLTADRSYSEVAQFIGENSVPFAPSGTWRRTTLRSRAANVGWALLYDKVYPFLSEKIHRGQEAEVARGNIGLASPKYICTAAEFSYYFYRLMVEYSFKGLDLQIPNNLRELDSTFRDLVPSDGGPNLVGRDHESDDRD